MAITPFMKPFPYEWSTPLVPLRMNSVTTIIYHHMDHPTWTLLDVHLAHLRKGWKGIGYNYWIDFQGTIWVCRGLNYGGHSASSNGISLGIGFQGDFDTQQLTDAQYNAGVWLTKMLMEEHNIRYLKGHKEVDKTACPAKNFPLAEMKALKYRGTLVQPKYYKIASTHIIEVNPFDLMIQHVNAKSADIGNYNLVNGGYFWWDANNNTYPLGILVSEGRILSNRQPHNKPAGTLMVYNDGSVIVKETMDVSHEKGLWFAISGCSILPKINMVSAGFTGKFSDIGRATTRPIIGYNAEKDKIVIAVRPDSNIDRANLTARNLGMDYAITLDAGMSTNLRVKGSNIIQTARKLDHILTW